MKTEVIRWADGQVIGERILEATFDEWLTYIFERPDGELVTHWSFGEKIPYWEVDATITSRYVAQTYEESKTWTKRYSVKQIADGISFTHSSSLGDVFAVFTDDAIPWDDRRRAIQAITTLYRDCFQILCEPGLSHLNECSKNPLNGVCYMFWDIFPIYGQAEDKTLKERDDECLRVMERTLQIDHEACRESSLHGLGHWALSYRARASSIIEQSLKTVRKRLRPELLSYADRAKSGNVL